MKKVCVGIHVEIKLTKIILEITNYSAFLQERHSHNFDVYNSH